MMRCGVAVAQAALFKYGFAPRPALRDSGVGGMATGATGFSGKLVALMTVVGSRGRAGAQPGVAAAAYGITDGIFKPLRFPVLVQEIFRGIFRLQHEDDGALPGPRSMMAFGAPRPAPRRRIVRARQIHGRALAHTAHLGRMQQITTWKMA